MSLVSRYKDIPVQSRVGNGMYTYKCVLDTDETGVVKIEIFANSPEIAVNLASMQFGAVLNWSYIGDDIISLILAPYSSGTCLLYL